MISEAVKYKILIELSKGSMSRSDVGDMFRSRSKEYREAAFNWLSDKVFIKYKISSRGRQAEIFELSPAGNKELDRLKGICIEG